MQEEKITELACEKGVGRVLRKWFGTGGCGLRTCGWVSLGILGGVERIGWYHLLLAGCLGLVLLHQGAVGCCGVLLVGLQCRGCGGVGRGKRKR